MSDPDAPAPDAAPRNGAARRAPEAADRPSDPAHPDTAPPADTTEAPAAEVQVVRGTLEATIPFPEVTSHDLDFYVGSNLLLVWSKTDPDHMRTMVRLPVDVRPDTAVGRFNNGVFDLTVQASPDGPQDVAPAPPVIEDGRHAPTGGPDASTPFPPVTRADQARHSPQFDHGGTA